MEHSVESGAPRAKVITLCGSTRFKSDFESPVRRCCGRRDHQLRQGWEEAARLVEDRRMTLRHLLCPPPLTIHGRRVCLCGREVTR